VGRFQREIVIAAPPAAVFDYLAEPERIAEWTPGVVSVRRGAPGPISLGSTTETVVDVFGTRQTLLGRCIGFDPPRRLAVENRTAGGIKIGAVTLGGISTVSTSELVPEGAGTRLRATLDYTLEVGGFMRGMAEAVAGPRMQADFEQSLRNLQRVFDLRAGAG
jgi:carbon monoxide dehydrogenase subunit G